MASVEEEKRFALICEPYKRCAQLAITYAGAAKSNIILNVNIMWKEEKLLRGIVGAVAGEENRGNVSRESREINRGSAVQCEARNRAGRNESGIVIEGQKHIDRAG